MDNVEERQSRIQEEQRQGGAETAYAIAVTHMLKSEPPTRLSNNSRDSKNGVDEADLVSDPSESDDSEPDSEATEEDGEHKGRGWSERRARLKKDGMHGRRLPPREAHEERAIAKAEKKEVGRFEKGIDFDFEV